MVEIIRYSRARRCREIQRNSKTETGRELETKIKGRLLPDTVSMCVFLCFQTNAEHGRRP
jgi:hypothetical protein